MYRVVVDPLAKGEILAAKRWYRARSPEAAHDFAVEVRAAVRRVAENPFSYGIRFHEFRQCIVHRFPFAVVYRIMDEHVRIEAVAHASREPGYWQRRPLA